MAAHSLAALAASTVPPPPVAVPVAAAPATQALVRGANASYKEVFTMKLAQWLLAYQGTVAPPAVIDAAHVAAMLTLPYGRLGSCINPNCEGLQMPYRTPLMRFLTPVQLAHYHATGQLPHDECQLCYLCLLQLACVAAQLNQRPGHQGALVVPPFCHPVGIAGGYVPAAMFSPSAAQCAGVVYPVRNFDLADYVPVERSVHVPAAFDRAKVATAWEQCTVRGYAEQAHLLHGTGAPPPAPDAAFSSVAVAGASVARAEALLLAALHPDVKWTTVPVAALAERMKAVFGINHPALALTLGGVVAPADIAVPDDGASPTAVRDAILLAPLGLARARLFHYVLAQRNDWNRALGRLGLLPSNYAHPRAAELELRPPAEWTLLYIVTARTHYLNEWSQGDKHAQLVGAAVVAANAIHATMASTPLDDVAWWTFDRNPLLALAAEPLLPAACFPNPHAPRPVITSQPARYPGEVAADAVNRLSGLADEPNACAPYLIVGPVQPPLPPAIDTRFWRPGADVPPLTVHRVNTIYETLVRVESAAAALEARLAARAAAHPATWLPADWQAELMRRIVATLNARARTLGYVDVMRHLVPVVKAMPPADAIVLAWHKTILAYEGFARDLKNALVALLPSLPGLHQPLGTALTRAVSDVVCATTPAVPSPYAWVVAAALPTGVTSSDFGARHAAARKHNAHYDAWIRGVVLATLTGLTPGARNIAPVATWLRLAAQLDGASPPLLADAALVQLAVREHVVATVAQAGVAAQLMRVAHADWDKFVDATRNQADAVRTGVALAATHAYAVPSWQPMRRQSPPFVEAAADAFRALDVDLFVELCIAERALRPMATLALAPALVRGIFTLVQQRLRPGTARPLDAELLAAAGLSRDAIGYLQHVECEYTAGAVNASELGKVFLRPMAAAMPGDYPVAAVLMVALAVHARRALYGLDASTADMAAHAMGERANGTACTHAFLGPAQCCFELRTFVVQSGAHFSGPDRVRLNLGSGRMTCAPQRSQEYSQRRASMREEGAPRLHSAFAEWLRTVARGAIDADVAATREQHLRALLRTHAQQMMRTRYHRRCGESEVGAVSVVGAVFEQLDAHGRGTSCMVCVRCSRRTAFSRQNVIGALYVCPDCVQTPPTPRQCPVCAWKPETPGAGAQVCPTCAMTLECASQCLLCSNTPTQTRRVARNVGSGGQRAFGTQHELVLRAVIDDSVPGTPMVRPAWVCGFCATPWLAAAAKHLPLSQLIYLSTNRHEFGGNLAELLDPEGRAARLRSLQQPPKPRKRRVGPVKS